MRHHTPPICHRASGNVHHNNAATRAGVRSVTASKIGAITAPKLIIHSPDDEIIPFAMGRALYEKAAEPKQFLEIKGGHNEGFLVSGNLYVDGLKDFLDRYFPEQQH